MKHQRTYTDSNETLRLVIEKAKKNGFSFDLTDVDHISLISFVFLHDFAKAFFGTDLVNFSIREKECFTEQEFKDRIRKYISNASYEFLETNVQFCWDSCLKRPRYLFHLQQMVLEENPLDYIEKFL